MASSGKYIITHGPDYDETADLPFQRLAAVEGVAGVDSGVDVGRRGYWPEPDHDIAARRWRHCSHGRGRMPALTKDGIGSGRRDTGKDSAWVHPGRLTSLDRFVGVAAFDLTSKPDARSPHVVPVARARRYTDTWIDRTSPNDMS